MDPNPSVQAIPPPDWLSIIRRLRDQDLTQAQIGEKIGWSREQVKNYIAILDKVGTEILDLAKRHQKGRVPEDGTTVPFDFTERWFRDSGLYGLCPDYQVHFMEAFLAAKRRWDKGRVQQETARLKRWQDFRATAEREQVAKYTMLADSVVPAVLDLAKQHQKGRGTEDVPAGTFDFTERWFRDSGLYGLCLDLRVAEEGGRGFRRPEFGRGPK